VSPHAFLLRYHDELLGLTLEHLARWDPAQPARHPRRCPHRPGHRSFAAIVVWAKRAKASAPRGERGREHARAPWARTNGFWTRLRRRTSTRAYWAF